MDAARTAQVIANRRWLMDWARFRRMAESTHARRRMFGGYGYLYGRPGKARRCV